MLASFPSLIFKMMNWFSYPLELTNFLNIIFKYFNWFQFIEIIILLKLKLSHIWQVGASSWLLNSLDMSLWEFVIWHDQIYLTHLAYFLPQTWNHPFLQETLVSFSRKYYFKATVWLLGICTATGLVVISKTLL